MLGEELVAVPGCCRATTGWSSGTVPIDVPTFRERVRRSHDGPAASYHGWKFAGVDGRCIDQPFEEVSGLATRFSAIGCVLVSYWAEGSLRFGSSCGRTSAPDPAPLIPFLGAVPGENCFAQIMFHEVPCNWLQCQENSIDPVHFEWLHANWLRASREVDGYGPAHMRLGFDEWEFGFAYRRIHIGEDETTSVGDWPAVHHAEPVRAGALRVAGADRRQPR